MKSNEKYSVNPAAESISTAVASIVLAISLILAVVCLVASFASGGDMLPALLISGVAIAVIGVISWASMRMLVNISRSLYNINDALRKGGVLVQNNAITTSPGKSIEQSAKVGKKEAKFSTGQLVIIKENENQFRIDEVDDSVDVVLYYSNKYEKYFTEDEIEDFDAYWKDKK